MRISKDEKKELCWIIVIANIIFVVLYRNFIFGDASYVYGGIGFDTYSQYLPYFIFEADQVQSGNLLGYTLQMGLGGNPFGRIISRLNPFEFILLFCNSANMYIGLLVSLYLKLMCISIVSYLFFKRLFSNPYARISCAMIWTYSSYITLWGQHYDFATNMAYFTILMYLLQRYLENKKFFSKWIPLVIFAIILKSYYMLYMIGIYTVVYIICYGFINRIEITNTLKKIAGLGLMAVLGIFMGAFSILFSVGGFFGSSRSSGMSLNIMDQIFNFRNFDYLYTTVARLLSNNMLGTEDYAGWGNYYEAPMLFTSALFIFAVAYSLFEKGRGKKILLYILAVFAVFSVMVSKIMTGFSGEYLRWSFCLVFSMVIVIGVMLDKVFNESELDTLKVKKSIVVGAVIYLCLYAFLYLYQGKTFAQYDKVAVVISLAFTSWYFISLMLVHKSNVKVFSRTILAFIVCELIVCNYITINDRDIVTKIEAQIYAVDQGAALADYLDEYDDGIYRIKKSYGIVQLNDAVAEGYNGFSSYISVVPASINQYMDDNQVPPMLYSTCIDIPMDRYITLSLLGEKYLIAGIDAYVDSTYYEQIRTYGEKALYENKYALPFGYMYYNQVDKTALEGLDVASHEFVMTKAFYYTEEEYQEYDLQMIDIPQYDTAQIVTNISELGSIGLENIEFKNNIFSANINNSKSEGMLCVPIFYESHWKAYVDGEEQNVENINGGLIGIYLSEGEHEIRLEYENVFLNTGFIVSIVAWIAYVSIICYKKIFYKKHNRNREDVNAND